MNGKDYLTKRVFNLGCHDLLGQTVGVTFEIGSLKWGQNMTFKEDKAV